MLPHHIWPRVIIAASALSVDCGGSTNSRHDPLPDAGPDAGTTDTSQPIWVVGGPADTHCVRAGGTLIKTSIGMCTADAPDASATDAGLGGGTHFGATMYNAEGADDDCKYHVSWFSSPIQENTNVMFTLTATRLADGQPAKGANVGLTAFLTPTHPTPSPSINNGELPGGTYNIGPVVFDAPGMWTVRFVLYPTCSDVPADSPQGHAAFYVAVP